jgi:hypothetical protein
MATVAETRTGRRPLAGDGENATITWAHLATGDSGRATSEHADFNERTVHVFGTFGGATVSVKGSLDGVNYAVLTDPQGNALTFTEERLEAISEATPYLKPEVTGGAAADITVVVFAKRNAK